MVRVSKARYSIFILALTCLLSLPVFADTRVALVIGNANYASVGKLTNTTNDAVRHRSCVGPFVPFEVTSDNASAPVDGWNQTQLNRSGARLASSDQIFAAVSCNASVDHRRRRPALLTNSYNPEKFFLQVYGTVYLDKVR